MRIKGLNDMERFIRNIIFLLLVGVIGLATSTSGDVFVDQVGFLPDAEKYVFVSPAADAFTVHDATTDEAVLTGSLSLFVSNDPATGLTLYRGDFSELTEVGTYYISVEGNAPTPAFVIAPDVYNDLYRQSLKGFYFQRCGVALLGDPAAPYFHTTCHVADGFYHDSTGQQGFHPASRGWHDAGDYGKYVVNAGITVGTMLMAYEEFPQHFMRDDLTIPESGNGIPDLLDEIRFELEWLLKMQDASGGAYHKLTRETFSGFVMPQDDDATRYIYQISSTATGDLAAVLARAARVFEPIDSEFAATCLAAAEQAWQFLEANPTIVPPGGFSNPSGTNTGTYGDGNDSDERLWAAAELFRTTGEMAYHNYYTTNYDNGGLFTSTMGWPNVRPMAHLAYLRCEQPDVNEAIRTALRNSLVSYCQNLVFLSDLTGFQVAMETNDYNWGSNSVPLNRAVLLIMGYAENENPAYRETALDQLHYVLGTNAHQICFVTGLGSIYPLYPHHRQSAADGIVQPVPGLLAGGPDRNLSDPVLQSHFDNSTPPALCYIDDEGSYASNEIAINWNAPLVFVSGYFSGESTNNVESHGSLVPSQIELKQNYPNPFNDFTTIRYRLNRGTDLDLRIYNLAGKIVAEHHSTHGAAGHYSLTWDGTNRSGEPVSAGVYFYQLLSENISQTRKMVLLRH